MRLELRPQIRQGPPPRLGCGLPLLNAQLLGHGKSEAAVGGPDLLGRARVFGRAKQRADLAREPVADAQNSEPVAMEKLEMGMLTPKLVPQPGHAEIALANVGVVEQDDAPLRQPW